MINMKIYLNEINIKKLTNLKIAFKQHTILNEYDKKTNTYCIKYNTKKAGKIYYLINFIYKKHINKTEIISE